MVHTEKLFTIFFLVCNMLIKSYYKSFLHLVFVTNTIISVLQVYCVLPLRPSRLEYCYHIFDNTNRSGYGKVGGRVYRFWEGY